MARAKDWSLGSRAVLKVVQAALRAPRMAQHKNMTQHNQAHAARGHGGARHRRPTTTSSNGHGRPQTRARKWNNGEPIHVQAPHPPRNACQCLPELVAPASCLVCARRPILPTVLPHTSPFRRRRRPTGTGTGRRPSPAIPIRKHIAPLRCKPLEVRGHILTRCIQ